MYEYETALWNRGIRRICGTDEAGRGPLAGPVVAGAVILDPDFVIEGLNDSKKLSEKKRTRLAEEIKIHALAWGIGVCDETEIDRLNIYQASRVAMIRAIRQMAVVPEFVLTDAMPIPDAGWPFLPIIHGDALSASIAAASILAKTYRDAWMVEMASRYPGYGFEIHKGYPTRSHLRALEDLGPCAIHRRTYGPVKAMLERQMSMDLEEKPTCR
jgi:ribonuclease HII